jgi:hypothetical protein
MIKKTIVTSCYHGCPFFGLDGGPSSAMYCEHPSLDHHNYGGYIITQNNSHDRVPDECPLHKEPTTIEVSLGTGL